MSRFFTVSATGNYPSDNGVTVKAGDALLVVGGTTITAAVQRKMGDGSWETLPAGDYSSITGPVEFTFLHTGWYRLAATVVTGTWKCEVI